MSGHYKEREIKLIEETYFWDDELRVRYEIRAYNDDETYEVLSYCDDLKDIFKWAR